MRAPAHWLLLGQVIAGSCSSSGDLDARGRHRGGASVLLRGLLLRALLLLDLLARLLLRLEAAGGDDGCRKGMVSSASTGLLLWSESSSSPHGCSRMNLRYMAMASTRKHSDPESTGSIPNMELPSLLLPAAK